MSSEYLYQKHAAYTTSEKTIFTFIHQVTGEDPRACLVRAIPVMRLERYDCENPLYIP